MFVPLSLVFPFLCTLAKDAEFQDQIGLNRADIAAAAETLRWLDVDPLFTASLGQAAAVSRHVWSRQTCSPAVREYLEF